MKKRFTESQIVSAIKKQEGGISVKDICRELGISEPTFYNWKAKFGGMSVSDAQRLRALEDENGKLKRLLADAMLDKAALNDLLSKKW
jgi:putative transposase